MAGTKCRKSRLRLGRTSAADHPGSGKDGQKSVLLAPLTGHRWISFRLGRRKIDVNSRRPRTDRRSEPRRRFLQCCGCLWRLGSVRRWYVGEPPGLKAEAQALVDEVERQRAALAGNVVSLIDAKFQDAQSRC